MQPAGHLPRVEDVVPHRSRMSLLDRIVRVDDQCVVAEVDIHAHCMFAADRGVPAWIGVEYMAQAISAWSGTRAARSDTAPRLGLLLGSRRYESLVDEFPFGSRLRVQADCDLFGDNGMGAFSCRIDLMTTGDPVLAARASLAVYESADARQLVARTGGASA